MVAAGVVCLLAGVWFVVVGIRPHPDSEAGSLTGSSAFLVKVGGVGTGLWLILTSFALMGHDPQGALDILMVFAGLYFVLSAVVVVALLAGGLGRGRGADDYGPDPRPGDRTPRPPTWYYR
jgi:hypothetical protein